MLEDTLPTHLDRASNIHGEWRTAIMGGVLVSEIFEKDQDRGLMVLKSSINNGVHTAHSSQIYVHASIC
jgi:hypothetical protein